MMTLYPGRNNTTRASHTNFLLPHERKIVCCPFQSNEIEHRLLSLTAEFNSDEVLDAQILQEDSRGGRRFKQKGDFCIQLSVEGGEVKIGGLLVEKCRVPEVV